MLHFNLEFTLRKIQEQRNQEKIKSLNNLFFTEEYQLSENGSVAIIQKHPSRFRQGILYTSKAFQEYKATHPPLKKRIKALENPRANRCQKLTYRALKVILNTTDRMLKLFCWKPHVA